MDDVEYQVVQTNETKNLWMMCSIRSFKPMRQNRTAREGLHSTNTSKLVGEQNGNVKFYVAVLVSNKLRCIRTVQTLARCPIFSSNFK